ncbi:MAG: hypothetical protein JWO13_824 [Acidobacteriales bacterium]|nr:hypothetical protein [Terriglobales bacterium]
MVRRRRAMGDTLTFDDIMMAAGMNPVTAVPALIWEKVKEIPEAVSNTAQRAITGNMTQADVNDAYAECRANNVRAKGTPADLQKCFDDVNKSVNMSGGIGDAPGALTTWVVLGSFAVAGFMIATQ